jgi:hypothetical protein
MPIATMPRRSTRIAAKSPQQPAAKPQQRPAKKMTVTIVTAKEPLRRSARLAAKQQRVVPVVTSKVATIIPDSVPPLVITSEERQQQQEVFKRLDVAHIALSRVWMDFDEAHRALTLLRNNPDASPVAIRQITPHVVKYLNQLATISATHTFN